MLYLVLMKYFLLGLIAFYLSGCSDPVRFTQPQLQQPQYLVRKEVLNKKIEDVSADAILKKPKWKKQYASFLNTDLRFKFYPYNSYDKSISIYWCEDKAGFMIGIPLLTYFSGVVFKKDRHKTLAYIYISPKVSNSQYYLKEALKIIEELKNE